MPLRTWTIPALVLASATLAGCGDDKQAAPAASAPPPAVTVVRAASEEVRPSSTFTGRVEAKDKVDLRARVQGFLEQRLFTEGRDVKEGDLLFVIEKGPYEAAVKEAQAGVERAEAALKLADIEFGRQSELVTRQVAAQARLDDMAAKQGEARGTLLAQKAALEKAQLDLGYTDIRAPLAGRIGRASVSVGNFVGPSSNVLATIVSQDPIYVSFPVTQREMLALRRSYNPAEKRHYVVYLGLADGKRYPSPGTIDFLDVTVNTGTDTVQVRADFQNADRLLVDGQLVSVIAEADTGESAIVIPQQAIQIDQSGAFVLVVDKDDKAQVRRVELGPTRDGQVVVTKGVEADERIITEGIQRVRPGQAVSPAEASRSTT